MSTEPTSSGGSAELTLTDANTFSFLPGPMAGATCPACHRQILLKEVISDGACNSCDARLELTLSAPAGDER